MQQGGYCCLTESMHGQEIFKFNMYIVVLPRVSFKLTLKVYFQEEIRKCLFA